LFNFMDLVPYLLGFVALGLLLIAGSRVKVSRVVGLSRRRCLDEGCVVSLLLDFRNFIGRRSPLVRGSYVYATLRLLRDDDSRVAYFRGYLPSVNNTWRFMGPEAEVKLVNIVLGSDGISITDVLLPVPTAVELPSGIITSFDMRTGEPVGGVSGVSIRRIMSDGFGEKVAQSMHIPEVVKRTEVEILIYGQSLLSQRYRFRLSRALGIVGFQIDGEARLIEGRGDVNYTRMIRCREAMMSGCLGETMKSAWGWFILAVLLGLTIYLLSSLAPW